jgi:hypothetical protein
MRWLIAGLILATVGFILRRILRMDATEKTPGKVLGSMCRDLHTLYLPVAQEIETQTTILGITLNDAFGERDAGRHEMSWRVVRLAMGEWERLTALVAGLQTVLAKFLPTTDGVVVVRRVATNHFKSRSVIDNVALYEFLDQVLFSSKRRFALQLRLLFRTSALLSKEFHRTCRDGERTLDSSNELWTRLDYHFHDFDLIAKETLLAFRTLLACQTPAKAQEISDELQDLLSRSTRVSEVVTNP